MENKDLYHYESLNEMAFNFPEMTKKELEQAGAQRAADLQERFDALVKEAKERGKNVTVKFE